MKLIFFLAFFSIAVVFSQPAYDPANSKCVPFAIEIAVGTKCGNSSGLYPSVYCSGSAFCDLAYTQNCVTLYANGHACNYTCYGGSDCQTGYCSPTANTCQNYPTSTATYPPIIIAYEGGDCTAQNTDCHSSLDCINGVCKKWLSVPIGGACFCGGDCTPGNACINEVCTAQTGKVVGSSCTSDSDCEASVAVCFCNAPRATSGICVGVEIYNNATGDYNYNDGVFPAAAVTNCKAFVNQYITGGTITASNAAKALSNYDCACECAYTNGYSTVAKAWQGYNEITYNTPQTCQNPKSSGSRISSNLWIGFGMAILFLLI